VKTRLTNYWVSYSDLMAGLLFVLFAIIVISNFQYKRKLKVIGENIDLRANIAEKLQEKFNKKNITSVEVDLETGDIEFVDADDLVWFHVSESFLLPSAQNILDEVIPVYLEVLLDDTTIVNSLDRILIEGHASMEHDIPSQYLKDLELSEDRAHAVGIYILNNHRKRYAQLKQHLVTLGRSFADAEHPGINDSLRTKDRKVVIRYTLKYEKMMRDLIKMDNNNGR
jgi:outer membrane protein OmpA-like peptidoglycan-associated protein